MILLVDYLCCTIKIQPRACNATPMKSALEHKHSHYPASWRNLPSGMAMQQAVQQVCREGSRLCFGYHLLKLGNLSSEIELSDCTIKHQVRLKEVGVHANEDDDDVPESTAASLFSSRDELPFVENSIDAILLTHELDFAADPHQILREVDRVITPNGYVLLTGFNPFSIDGLVNAVRYKRKTAMAQARYFRQGRVIDWLHLLGFEIIEKRKFAHFSLFMNRQTPPVKKLNRFCQRYLPWSGSSYFILARKREVPLSLVKPKWRLKPNFSPVGASARSSSQL